jgi:hypothetical protein
MVAQMQNLAPGTEVSCPKCGKIGKIGVDRFRAGGKTYTYLTVRHYENGKVRRCVLGPYGEPTPGKGTNAKTLREGTYAEVPEAKTGAEVPEAAGGLDPVALDRAAWYITKLLLAYGTYRENPTAEKYAQLLNVLKQLRERLGVDVSAAEAALAKLHAQSTTDAVIAATTSMKELAKSIIARVLVPRKGTDARVPVQAPLPEAGNLVQSLRDAVREEIAKAVETIRVPQVQEVPREVVDAINAVRDQVASIQREIEYIKEQVRQRKGVGARAIARGEKRVEFKEGNLYWMIREIMSQGGEWTKEALVEEIKRRFGKEVSGNSVSGRLSELAAAGYVAFRRQGRTWLWRWTGT